MKKRKEKKTSPSHTLCTGIYIRGDSPRNLRTIRTTGCRLVLWFDWFVEEPQARARGHELPSGPRSLCARVVGTGNEWEREKGRGREREREKISRSWPSGKRVGGRVPRCSLRSRRRAFISRARDEKFSGWKRTTCSSEIFKRDLMGGGDEIYASFFSSIGSAWVLRRGTFFSLSIALCDLSLLKVVSYIFRLLRFLFNRRAFVHFLGEGLLFDTKLIPDKTSYFH